jgi:prepilin peptidase CpaA
MMAWMVPLVGVAVFVLAACADVRSRRIPNGLVGAVAALAIVRLALAGDASAASYTFAAAALVFAAGFILYWRGLIGGGDVKLTAAAVLLVGHHAVSEFLLSMSLCGLVVTLTVVVAGRLTPRLADARRSARLGAAIADPPLAGLAIDNATIAEATGSRPTVPYGVAIAGAGILTLLFHFPISG